MRRRAFLAGMIAAPVAAQLPPAVAWPVGNDLTATIAAQEAITATEVIGNQILTSDIIAKEALRLLKNNLVFARLQDGTLDLDEE